VRQISATPKPLAPATANKEEETEQGDEDDNDVERVDEAAESEAKPSLQRSAAKPPPLSNNLALNDEPMPLKTFLGTTSVTADSSDMDKVIAVATWMKEHRSLQEVGGGDFCTVCKIVGWTPPTDVTSPMRNLKRDAKMTSGTKSGKFVLTLVGENDFLRLKKNTTQP
jgi:hypothetical protein